MLEQIITSIGIIAVNISLYFLVFSKKPRKTRFLFVLGTHAFVFTSFFIPFKPEVFFAKHNIVLLVYSWPMLLMYIMIIPFRGVLLLMQHTVLKEKMNLPQFKLQRGLFNIAPVLLLVMVNISELVLIWDLDVFDELANQMFAKT